jgi:hypothetical protein
MAPLSSAGFVAAAACAVAWLGAALDPQQATGAAPPAAETASPSRTTLAGLWDYNDDESVIAATGRPERSPQGNGASQVAGRGGIAGRSPGAGSGGGGLAPRTGGPGGVGGTGGPPSGASRGRALSTNETRTLVRDLLEVPETLEIVVEDTAVTFTDDLGRVTEFPVDGKQRKYQMGAARFEASTFWQGGQLRKDVEGAYGFRMSETYLVSSDGQRLFVLLRVGDEKKKDVPVFGINRVYDRVTK